MRTARDCAPFAAENALQWPTEVQKSLDAYCYLSKAFLPLTERGLLRYCDVFSKNFQN